jgi:hypothetical protein
MTDISSGDTVTVTTPTINGGDPFDGYVLSVDKKTETVGVEPDNLPYAELVFVGFSEVER